jgi:hypothetical protein
MIRELDPVVLLRDLPAERLEAGDVGAVVHCYEDGEALEVEFVTGSVATVAVVTLERGAVRPIGQREILHARPLVA